MLSPASSTGDASSAGNRPPINPPGAAGIRAARPASDYSTVLRAVQGAGLLRRAYAYYALKIGATFAVLFGVIALSIVLGNTWLQLLVAGGLGVVITQIVFISHDAAHRQIFRSHAANENAALVMGVGFGGVSLAWWHNKHNRHHAAPNQIDKDPDLAASVVHFYPAAQPPRSTVLNYLHQRQGWWFFPLLVVEALNLHVQSVQALAVNPGFRRRRVEIGLLFVRLGLYPAALFVFLPPGKAAAFLGVQLAVTGLYLGGVFSASHIGMPVLDHDLRIDFFRRQVLTSRNIVGGRLISWAMGGLNLQIEHHLFPSVANRNLHRVRPLVRQFCAEREIDYEQMSLVSAWRKVAQYLNRVGLRSDDVFRCPLVASLRPV